MDNDQRRHSSFFHGRTSFKQIEQVNSRFTSPSFLTKHTLFSNLYASEPLSLNSADKDFIKLLFGKESICPPEIYQFTYLHKRDKKVLIYQTILTLLLNDNKTQLVILENGERLSRDDIRSFLKKYGQNILSEFNKRVHFHYSQTSVNFKFNLQFLDLFQKNNQFAKCLIISDINTFEFSDKAHVDKLYKRISKQFLTISLKKDTYQYRFAQKPQQSHNISNYTLNEKVLNVLNKKQMDNLYHAYIVPIQSIGVMSSNFQDSFRSVVFRKDLNDDLYQFWFKSYPYKVDTYRKIN